MSAEEVNKAIHGEDMESGRLGRGARRSGRWPEGVVPYVLSKSVSKY